MKLRSLIQTCEAFPSQWDGVLEDGRAVYIRYRWGLLTVRVNPNTPEETELYGHYHGDHLDGEIEEAEMLRLTGLEGPI
jgi:hypothetical protein